MDHLPHITAVDPSDDYWVRRCRVAEERVINLIRERDDQGLGSLASMAICSIVALVIGFGLGWWVS